MTDKIFLFPAMVLIAFLSGCAETSIYGVDKTAWPTLTNDQKLQAIDSYWQRKTANEYRLAETAGVRHHQWVQDYEHRRNMAAIDLAADTAKATADAARAKAEKKRLQKIRQIR